MKIYTKTGDKGETGLLGGTRVLKSHYRIEAYGTIDELNSYIGLLASFPVNQGRKEELHRIQSYLFTLGSHLAADPVRKSFTLPELREDETAFLEKRIDVMESELPLLKAFILPGGNEQVSFCHIARTICRRAERAVVALTEKYEKVDSGIIIYLNRLSDYLFVLARKLTQETGSGEIIWKP